MKTVVLPGTYAPVSQEAVRLKKAVTKYEEYRCTLQAWLLHNTEKKLEACMKLHNVYKNLPNPLLNKLITIENLYNIVYHCGE